MTSWPDGAIVGCGFGVCWRVFAPRWWELGRWLNWHLLEHRPHGTLEFEIGGTKMSVRVVMSDFVPPNVPSTEATVTTQGQAPILHKKLTRPIRM
jgi:hypothetical protein